MSVQLVVVLLKVICAYGLIHASNGALPGTGVDQRDAAYESDTFDPEVTASGLCQTYGDPQILTFDSYAYDVADADTFKLMDTGALNVTVQVKQQIGTCTLSVNCAIAVQSGNSLTSEGAQGEVLVIDRCSGPMDIYRCQEENTQNLILPWEDHIYNISTIDSDVDVAFIDWGGFADIDVEVPGSYSGMTPSGFCGNFDGDSTNDLEGLTLSEFIELNRVTGAESLFDCPVRYNMSSSCQTAADQITTFDRHSYTAVDQGIYQVLGDAFANRYIEVNRTAAGNCAVSVRSGTDPSSGGHRGEIILIDKCNGTVKVRKCQTEQTNPVVDHRDGTFDIITTDGNLKVRVMDRGTYLDVDAGYVWQTWPEFPMTGLCGNHDGNPSNEYDNLAEFMEANRVEPQDAMINCTTYYLAEANHVGQPGFY